MLRVRWSLARWLVRHGEKISMIPISMPCRFIYFYWYVYSLEVLGHHVFLGWFRSFTIIFVFIIIQKGVCTHHFDEKWWRFNFQTSRCIWELCKRMVPITSNDHKVGGLETIKNPKRLVINCTCKKHETLNQYPILLVTFLGWLNDLLERRIVTSNGLGDEKVTD